MRINLVFRGQAKQFVVEKTDRVADLLLVLQRGFDVDEAEHDLRNTPLRMLCEGRDVRRDGRELCDLVGEGGTVLVLLSDSTDAEKLSAAAHLAACRTGGGCAAAAASVTEGEGEGEEGESSFSSEFVLCLNPLRDGAVAPGARRRADARRMLGRLACDPGVVSVLRRHGWRIGCLSEVWPASTAAERSSSSSSSSFASPPLSSSRGEVLLRLCGTVDDPGGGGGGGGGALRPYGAVVEALLRELAHCAHPAGGDARCDTLCARLREEYALGCRAGDGCGGGGGGGPCGTGVTESVEGSNGQTCAATRGGSDVVCSEGERKTCPVCQEVMPQGCTDRFVSNHVESCLRPPPKLTCPICSLDMPEGSSERYLSNHVEQCVLGGLRGELGRPVPGFPSSSSSSTSSCAAATSSSSPPTSASRRAPAAATQQQASCSSAPASASAALAGDGVAAAAGGRTAEGGGPCCPVCQVSFPVDASARYIDNHVERCVSST